jgi:multicomponent Na+:H+ antiporter subunit F
MVEAILTYFALPIVAISIGLTFIRLVRGPSIEDRIVALDLLSIIGIAFLSVYAVVTESIRILDVGIILALLAFLGTVAFAYYLERRSKR